MSKYTIYFILAKALFFAGILFVFLQPDYYGFYSPTFDNGFFDIWLLVTIFVVFGLLGYFEGKKSKESGHPYYHLFLTTFLGCILLGAHPVFWSQLSGHPPVSGMFLLPFCFLAMLIPGIIGVTIFNFRIRTKSTES